MDSKFEIDFFEYSFLVEACIPPRPIARSMFWDKVINVHYNKLSHDERIELFNWIQKNNNFDLSNEQCLWFYKRFDPDNQYLVTYNYQDQIKKVHTFLHNGRYYTKINTSIYEEYIINVEKLINSNDDAINDVVDDAVKESKINWYPYETQLKRIDQLFQYQGSLNEQLQILRPFANKLGLYDAADYIKIDE